MRLLVLFLLGLVFGVKTQDVILESEEGHQNRDDNGVLDSTEKNEVSKVPNFILLCALIPQIPGCPCDPLLETRPTFYDFLPSDCSCYDSQQSGFSSSPCFCSKPDSDECKCLSGLSSLDEEHDRMCIVSPLTYVTPYANCTSFLNPLGEEGLCHGDLELSEHCITLRSCRRLTPISIEDSSVHDKCVKDPEGEGCPCSPDQLITDEDALICSCYRNSKNPGCPCDVEPESPICTKFTELLLEPSTSSSTTPEPSESKHSNETESTNPGEQKTSTSTSAVKTEEEKSGKENEATSQNATVKNEGKPEVEKSYKSSAHKITNGSYLSVVLILASIFMLH
ncbi:putative secreted protein, signal peptide [Cryptosporidium felis]|nr:putative secreted protein, signal peptide [Cryptosporidium felis]